MCTFIAGSVQASMLVRSSLGVVGMTSQGSRVNLATSPGLSIFRSFSMFLAISASSPGFYAEEVSDRCADRLSSVGIVFFVD
jgi:hypothetical protein